MVNVYRILCICLSGCALVLAAHAQDADPTRPTVRAEQLEQTAESISEYRLSTVWYRGANAQGQSSAVINGQRVERGDNVGPYVVEAIEPGQVLLKNDDGQVWLRVFRSNQLTIEPSRG